jgi:5S rRNA maturation endonuclease (ribonuclease M5)
MGEYEELVEWLEKIKQSKVLVIVEGKRDKAALAEFGIKRVKTLAKRAIYKVVEEVAKSDKKAIILTDLDKEGKKLFGLLNHGLCQNGVYVGKGFREFLFKNTKIRQIEGLKTYVQHLKEKS